MPVSDENVLGSTLLRSPEIDSGCQLLLERDYACAGTAYNAGVDASMNELLVFAHQDVYLPPGWLGELSVALRQLEAQDPDWGVLGVWGVAVSGRFAGFVHSTGLKRTLGRPFHHPIEAHTLDELLLITRRSSGLRFDESLPGFHFYGTDLCLQAGAAGRKNYAISAFCMHNSNGIKALPLRFWRSYLYVRKKWSHLLPVASPCAVIRKSCWGVLAEVTGHYKGALLRRGKVGSRSGDPEGLYRALLADQRGAR